MFILPENVLHKITFKMKLHVIKLYVNNQPFLARASVAVVVYPWQR